MPWSILPFGRRRNAHRRARQAPPPLTLEPLEPRHLADASAALAGGVLTVLGDFRGARLNVSLDAAGQQLVVQERGVEVGRFPSAAVNQINIDVSAGSAVVRVADDVPQATQVQGGPGDDVFYGGGGPTILAGGGGTNKLVAGPGPTRLVGGNGTNALYGGPAADVFIGGSGGNLLVNVGPEDTVLSSGDQDRVVGPQTAGAAPDPVSPAAPAVTEVLDQDEVDQLLRRAAAASSSNDGIIAVVDRNGRILGVRVEGGVSPAVIATNETLTFAIDGAVAKARTGAFFANNQAPLTSRTVQFISQSTVTQREVNANPNVPDPNSILRGPGFVAPVGQGGHFPPGIPLTPTVDLFGIEHTNRDSIVHPGPDHMRGTADDILLPNRFNVPEEFLPGIELFPPESYGFEAFADGTPAHDAQSRGIATLPGGIPLYQKGQLVGGIGVFFPGATGFASEENSRLSATFDPSRPDRSLEAEYIAFAAAGGAPDAAAGVGEINGVPALPGFALPFGRIDLVGITLTIFGPDPCDGPLQLLALGRSLGPGNPDSGFNAPLDPAGGTSRTGLPAADGWLVLPHDGRGPAALTAADVTRIIEQGVTQANVTRAAIRLPLGSRTRMVFAVTDTTGEVLGLFRMPDATVFSEDVAVAKARNVAYYADPTQLQPIDQVPGVPAGAAFTNRTFRYLALPHFPEGIDSAPPGPFSIYNDGGVNPVNGLQVGPPLPASAFDSVFGFDAFNPGTNFRDPSDVANQNGVVFFPGSAPLYKLASNGQPVLVGGLGVSGDGVDQDDVVTAAAVQGYEAPPAIRADEFFFQGVRLPYQKFNRNPVG